jgi:very-short-patch-repair endonuclease
MLLYNGELKSHAQELRKHMTVAEIRLWARLRLKRLNGHIFQRQRIIGNCIVDIYCPKAKLVIEVDGGQHLSHEKVLSDTRRDSFLKSNQIAVLRFTDTRGFTKYRGRNPADIVGYRETPPSQEQAEHFTPPGSLPFNEGGETEPSEK